MEEEEKNKETENNDLGNNQSLNSNEISNNDTTNNSEAFRHVSNQKIKINEEKLKDAKEKSMEIKSESNISNSHDKNPNNLTKDNNLMQSTFQITDHHNIYYLRLNRCLTAKLKKIILLILLIISIFFLFISIFDIINTIKKSNFYKENKFLMNYFVVFFTQSAYSLSLFWFQGLIIILEPKDNLLFNILSLLLIFIVITLRTVLVIKNDNKNSTLLFNFLSCFCLTFINLALFLITLKILKMKKNVQQNIEEIINFTDILQGTNSKIAEKNNQLMLNNSGIDNKQDSKNENTKDGISALVEESNNNSSSVNNESISEQK